MQPVALALVASVTLTGCGTEVLNIPCVNDSDCDDDLFCNGEEICRVVSRQSTTCVRVARDCSAMDGVCGPGVCNEALNQCQITGVDADGDGHDSSACGGDDCDDDDAARYAGNTEVCDNNHDEDCNDATYGADADGDGFESSACCNGPDNCGPDCDDSLVSVNPSGSEICNGIDDDCNGTIDDGVAVAQYLDSDRDGYGVAGGTPTDLCPGTADYSPLNNDCNDKNAAITPGTMECFVTPQTSFNVRLCTSEGIWSPASCPVAKPTCYTQPTGLGVCL